MTPEEKQQLDSLQKEVALLRSIMMGRSGSVEYRNTLQRYTLNDPIFKVTSPQLGFYGATPVTQQAHIADATGGIVVDSQCRAVQNSIVDVLEAYGLTAKS